MNQLELGEMEESLPGRSIRLHKLNGTYGTYVVNDAELHPIMRLIFIIMGIMWAGFIVVEIFL